jgi:mannobiose 2-epimerase
VTLSLAELAGGMRAELASKVLPYWFDTAQDLEHGGYRLADDAVEGRGVAREKQLVTQSRMLWGFAHAHRKGFSTRERSYLAAAEQGHRFLQRHFLDRKRGGYFWKTDPTGEPISDVKNLYAQAFVIYALVELHRAGGRSEPLEQALDLYRTLQRRAHDRRHGGWLEHFTRSWRLITKRTPGAEIEVPGLKSANAHLHLMEAYTELYDATRDAAVKDSLAEAIEINRTHFFPERAGSAAFHRERDWRPVTRPQSDGLCYGHNVEFAWLMIRAQQVLGVPPAWSHFTAVLDHTLRHGCDPVHGGVFYLGQGDEPATNTDKEWWAQAEMLAALTEGLKHEARADYRDALEKLIRFVWSHQVDPRDGIWLATVAADGTPKNTSKAHGWKANYHDLRAITKFIEAFGG